MSKYCNGKYEKRSVYYISKETSLKRRKKYKNHWQVEYHHTGEEEKLCKLPYMELEPGRFSL